MNPNKKRSGDVIANNTRETTLENRFPNLSPVSLHGEIVQPSSAIHACCVSETSLTQVVGHDIIRAPGGHTRKTVSGTYEVSHVCLTVVLRSTGAFNALIRFAILRIVQTIAFQGNKYVLDFQCKAEGVCWHQESINTVEKTTSREYIKRSISRTLTLIYRGLS